MKYLKTFKTLEDYENYLNSDELVVHHVAYIEDENIVKMPPSTITATDYNKLMNGLINIILNTEI
jgi:hypothetical protein